MILMTFWLLCTWRILVDKSSAQQRYRRNLMLNDVRCSYLTYFIWIKVRSWGLSLHEMFHILEIANISNHLLRCIVTIQTFHFSTAKNEKHTATIKDIPLLTLTEKMLAFLVFCFSVWKWQLSEKDTKKIFLQWGKMSKGHQFALFQR